MFQRKGLSNFLSLLQKCRRLRNEIFGIKEKKANCIRKIFIAVMKIDFLDYTRDEFEREFLFENPYIGITSGSVMWYIQDCLIEWKRYIAPHNIYSRLFVHRLKWKMIFFLRFVEEINKWNAEKLFVSVAKVKLIKTLVRRSKLF